MKFKLTAILLISFTTSLAQNIIDKEDPFTHEKIKSATVVFGNALAPQPITLCISEKNEKKYLEFAWTSPSGNFGEFADLNPEDCSLMFKFNKDTIVVLRPGKGSAGKINSGPRTLLYINCEITDDQLFYFIAREITNFRIGTTKDGNGIDMDGPFMFTNRNKRQFKEAGMFILGLLPDQSTPVDSD